MNYFFISGTSGGIGLAIASQLLQDKNITVFGFSRKLVIEHNNYHHYFLDLSNSEGVLDFQFPSLPNAEAITLINNAATLGDIKYFGNLIDEKLSEDLYTNLIAPAVLINKFIRTYKEMNTPKLILNLGSGASTNPYDGWSMYCASKAGLEMLSRSVALEQEIQKDYPPFHVLNIAPGVVDTNMQSHIRNQSAEEFSRIGKFIELKEKGQLYSPDEVAKRIIAILNDPHSIEGVSHRISIP